VPLYFAKDWSGPLRTRPRRIAAYNHTDIHEPGSRAERLILMRCSSYRIGDFDSQPLVGRQTSYPRSPFAPSSNAFPETSVPASKPLRARREQWQSPLNMSRDETRKLGSTPRRHRANPEMGSVEIGSQYKAVQAFP
jgi:hypothetical protein